MKQEAKAPQEPVLFGTEGTYGAVEMLDGKIRVRRKSGSSLFTHGHPGEKDILIARLSSIGRSLAV